MTQTKLETRITDVTLFRDGARVTRKGQVKLAPGEHVLTVSDITQYAQEDSFRVRGTGDASLKSIDVKSVSRTFEPEGELKKLRAELEELKRRRDVINERIQNQQKRISRLNNIANKFASAFGKWYAVGQTKAENITTMDKTTMELLRESKKTLRELSNALLEVDLAIKSTESNIQRIQGQRRIETFTEVKITLNVTQNTNVELQIDYQVYNADWRPTYDVDTSESGARVKRIALVRNNSLEDWRDVALTVSTASAIPVEAIKPQPFYIDVMRAMYRAPSASGRAEPYPAELGAGIDLEISGFLSISGAEPEELGEAYAERADIGGTTVYSVPGRLNIASEAEPQPITLTEETFTCSRIHYWNAYAMSEVVVQDEITNGDSVILPGKVMAYAEGDFVGESQVGLIAPREKFRIGTRTVYDVRAEKKLVRKDTEKAGITKGKRRRAYEYRLVVKSFSKTPVTIRIVDRIPNSVSEKIVVTLESTSLPPTKSVEMGIIEWLTTIEPGKELQIDYKYAVEWDSEVIIRPELP